VKAGKVFVTIVVKLSLWSAIKLRIAGIQNRPTKMTIQDLINRERAAQSA
jgi:hypothetical protein